MSLRAFLPRAPDLRAMLALALPVAGVQVGMMLMGVVDTMMVGRLSGEALAAVALGNILMFGAAGTGMGVLFALDPVITQAVGAHDHDGERRAIQHGIALAILLSIPLGLASLPSEWLLRLFRQHEEVIPLAASYTRSTAVGLLPFFLFLVGRQALQARGRLAPVLWTIALSNGLNLVLNWVFIWGHWGAPAMGAVGSGWATCVSRFAMGGLIFALGWPELGPAVRAFGREAFGWTPLRRLLALGIPSATTLQLEYSAFAVVGMMMGTLGSTQVAAHQVALNLAALTFMVPVGVAAAGAVLVGQAIGRGDPDGMRRAAGAALAIGVGFMCATAVLFLVLPAPLAGLYTREAAVVELAATLIPIAGLFQVFDGTQAVAIGILRGAADTRAPMIINILGFWLVGVPVSWGMGLALGGGPRGAWWGFVCGLAAVALLLLARVRSKLRHAVARFSLAEAP